MRRSLPVEPTDSIEAEQHARAAIAEILRRLHICRGTTGDTIREALPVIEKRIGVQRHDIPELDTDAHPHAARGTLGQCVIRGSSNREIVLAAPTSAPSTNDHDLTGLALLTALCEWLASTQPRLTYRAIFAPAALSVHSSLRLLGADPGLIHGGMDFCQLGGAAPLLYQRSRSQRSLIDRVVERTVAQGTDRDLVVAQGCDERPCRAAGLDARIGTLRRGTPYRSQPYRTPATGNDTGLAKAFGLSKQVIENLEYGSQAWLNLFPYGEPCLGKRGLYQVANPRLGPGAFHMAMLWVLNLSDGGHSLLDIAERSDQPLSLLADAADRLREGGLLEPIVQEDGLASGIAARGAG